MDRKNQPGADMKALMDYVDSVVAPVYRQRSNAQFASLLEEQPETLRGKASRRIGQALYDTGYLMPSDAMGLGRGSTFVLDVAPGVGDYMAFEEAETPLDYGLATVGAVPGIGDALGLAMAVAPAAKMAKAASKAPDIQAADEVLDLLKAGRGSDVTDELMARADTPRGNAYLAENYDLPLDRASRMARADEMGMSGGLYRGEHTAKKSFTESPKGRNFSTFGSPEGYEVTRAGTFFSDNPDFANEYAKTFDKNFRVTNPDGAVVGNYAGPRKAQPLPASYTLADYVAEKFPDDATLWNDFRYSNGSWDMLDDDMGAAVKDFAENSRPNGRVKAYDFEEYGTLLDNDEVEIPSNTVVVFDPADIRSVNARFDPRLKHLRNLMAGGAGIGLGLGMAAPRIFPYQEDEQL